MQREESGLNQAKINKCLEYIEQYWETILCYQVIDDGTLIGLPYHYISPNHGMFQEMYYWDSYFIALGLESTAREDKIIEITENLLYLMTRFGRIPNASRYYYLSRSQPPLLSSLVLKSFQIKFGADTEQEAAKGWLKERFEVLKLEYHHVWRGKEFPDEREVFRGLSRYYDLNIWHNAAEAESGWDMTPRFDDRCLHFLPIDLNCLLFQYEHDFFEIAGLLGDQQEASRWRVIAEARRQSVHDLMWDEERGYFFDYDYHFQHRSSFASIAGFFALWSKIATEDQAKRIVSEHLPLFETQYGVVTTLEWHRKDDEEPKQWAWPNGWAPLHWIVVSGLAKYGFHQEAKRIAKKWVDLVADVFVVHQQMYEKYDVVGGTRGMSDRYPDQVGFGWTNSIFYRFVQYIETGQLWYR